MQTNKLLTKLQFKPMNYPETISIKEYLNQKCITYKEANNELITTCVFCNKKDHLYFSPETSQYDCKKCGETGNIYTLSGHLGDDKKDIIADNFIKEEKITYKKQVKSIPITKEKVEKYHQNLPESIREYLNNRGITNELISLYKLGYGEFGNQNWITIPIKNKQGEYSYLKLRRDLQNEDLNPKYKFSPTGSSSSLFGVEMVKDNDTIIICEGEFDCILLNSYGLPAITSTAGAKTFKKEWLEDLKELKKIYLCFDKDESGEEGAQRVAKLIAINLPKTEIFKIDLPEMKEGDKDVTDYITKNNGNIDELFNLAQKLELPPVFNDFSKQEDKEEVKERAVTKLLKFLEERNAVSFIDQLHDTYVAINGDGSQVYPLDSKSFQNWLIYQLHKNNLSFADETIKKTKQCLSGQSMSSNETKHLSLRVAWENNNLWYDLGNKAICINKDGWSLNNNPPILFRRFKHQKEQVEPQTGRELKEFLNLTNLKNEEDKILLQVYLVSCLIPGFPHPVLVLHGEQGAAKSTLFRFIKDLIDPSALKTLSPIKDSKQLVQVVAHHWVALFDNLSGLSNDLSDCICRACTGEGFSKRKLYSDDDDFIYNIQHIIGINGIGNVVSKPDLLDRSILIELSRISEEQRKGEDEIKKHFDLLKPKLLGACFDALVKTIKIKPQVKLKSTPRMADFSEWGFAIAEALNIGGDNFLKAYEANIEKQNKEALEASPIAIAVIELLKKEPTSLINASPEYILQRLKEIADEFRIDYISNKFWPRDARWLWRRLQEIAPNLKKVGILVEKGKTDERFIKITDIKQRSWKTEDKVLKDEQHLPPM